MTAVYKIDRYEVKLWSSKPTTDLNPNSATAGIFLYEQNNYRGYAYFFADGTPLSAPVIDSANGFIATHYNMSQFPAVLQLLREEEPIYLYEFGGTEVGIMTGAEPTGEEEGAAG